VSYVKFSGKGDPNVKCFEQFGNVSSFFAGISEFCPFQTLCVLFGFEFFVSLFS
jgi:hypothetical protein